MNIVEAITRKGIKSTNSGDSGWMPRLYTPRSGDNIRWADGTFGRFWYVGTGYCEADEAMVCETQGSAFLTDDGNADISGGPFRTVKLADLTPTLELRQSHFWNWGNNGSGADRGVHFTIARPVFAYTPEGDSQ